MAKFIIFRFIDTELSAVQQRPTRWQSLSGSIPCVCYECLMKIDSEEYMNYFKMIFLREPDVLRMVSHHGDQSQLEVDKKWVLFLNLIY